MNALIEQLSSLSGIGVDAVWRYLTVFMRVGAMMSLLPAFGEQAIPQRLRLLLALAFATIVFPSVLESPMEATAPLRALVVETLIGLLLGIGLRLFVLCLQTAGAMAAQATTLSQMFGDAGPEPQPALGNLLVMAGLAIAVATGFHIRVVQFIIVSYDLFPVGKLPAAAEVARWGLGQITTAFSLAFSLAVPFTIAALLYNVALGVINRAMPALMVSFIGAPALTAFGLVMMALVVPAALSLWSQALQGFLANPFQAQP